MNLILKTNYTYLVSIDSDTELFFISPQNPIKLTDCDAQITFKFYPTKNITSTVKMLPAIETLTLINNVLVSSGENSKVTHFGNNNYVVEFKKISLEKSSFSESTIIPANPYSNISVIIKNFGKSQALLFNDGLLVLSHDLDPNFYAVEYIESNNLLVLLLDFTPKTNFSNISKKAQPLLINKDISSLNNKGYCIVFDLETLATKFTSEYNLLNYDNAKKTLSLLLKDDSLLKTATTYEMNLTGDLIIKKNKVHLSNSGSIKGLIPKKLIPLAFFNAVKTENYKESRFFLSDELNKSLDDKNLSSFLESFYSLETNPFAVFDTNSTFVKNENGDLLPIEFKIEKNKITNIKF